MPDGHFNSRPGAVWAESKPIKERLRDIKKAWTKAPRNERLEFLLELSFEAERTVDDFLLDTVEKDLDFDTASEAARCLVMHKNPKDSKDLTKLYNRCKEPQRRSACVRWLGKYGPDAPVGELKGVAISEDASAAAAAQALIDAASSEALKHLDTVAQISKNADARKIAVGGLLKAADKRGLDGISKLTNIEDASFAAHYAIGGELETDSLLEVLKFARKTVNLGIGVRPHLFGSFLVRLTKPASHQALTDAVKELDKSLNAEILWWVLGHSRSTPDLDVASGLLEKEGEDDILWGLRYLQRAPKPLTGDALKEATEALAAHLKSANEKIASHALLAAGACGVRTETVETMIKSWFEDKDPKRRACSLLAIAGLTAPDPAQYKLEHFNWATKALADENWFVVSAALECLRVIRLPSCPGLVLEAARVQKVQRLFSECIALLIDYTGQDFGDDLKAWGNWLAEHPEFIPLEGKLTTLRGYRYKRSGKQTRATFYGLEIESDNVEFALDRSISMIDPVTREPRRIDFKVRKADVLKRRAEVNRMVRDGFLPRFYVACCEVSAALDGLEADSQFGITLINTESVMMGDKRMVNDPGTRKNAVNWMLSSEVKGGTDIKAALVALCERGDADTVLLLSDGDPLSLALIEQIQRANAVTRVNIEVITLHRKEFSFHYLSSVAKLNAGRIVEAEPRE